MPQANLPSVTPRGSGLIIKKMRALKVTMLDQMKRLHASILAARKIVPPTVFADGAGSGHIKTIMVPVPDNGWAPAMWCGEFAIVEVTNLEPEDGAFIVRRSGSTENLAIVRLRLRDNSGPMKIVKKRGEDLGVYWSILYGAQCAMRLDGRPLDDGDFLNHFHMADGPLADHFMRAEIIGRVVGVLGHEDRSLNWHRWVPA